MKKREDSAIKKALKEAEDIFGQPVTFKVRNSFGDLVEASEEDIAKIEEEGKKTSQQQISRKTRGWKFSVSADIDGSTTTFRETESDGKIKEVSVYEPRAKTPELPKIENRFEEIKNDSDDDSDEKEKNGKKMTESDKKDSENFTLHQQILPKNW